MNITIEIKNEATTLAPRCGCGVTLERLQPFVLRSGQALARLAVNRQEGTARTYGNFADCSLSSPLICKRSRLDGAENLDDILSGWFHFFVCRRCMAIMFRKKIPANMTFVVY
jgi:hypothetical protein